jgi:hypothetical protein
VWAPRSDQLRPAPPCAKRGERRAGAAF